MKTHNIIKIGMTSCLIFSLLGCGGSSENVAANSSEPTPSETPTPTPTPDPYAAPAGTYFSETTGQPIADALKNQRPIAAMVDCETLAFPHYGIAEADIVYELMNSIKNGRITRFMAVYKDYANIPQIGSIRSTRTTNVWLASEWNAIICHDGQAEYALDYLAKDYAQQHLSGIFTRVQNGKAWEFTEYIMAGDVTNNAAEYGIDLNYNQYKQNGDHFNFVKYTTELDTSNFQNATTVQLPYDHNQTSLTYNSTTKTYDLSMYGELHQDEDDGQTLTFKNAFILDSDYSVYPDQGNIYYHIVDNSGSGYYLTDGKMEQITWKKAGENGITQYFDTNGNQITVNRGKTYITYVPSDVWPNLSIK